MPGNLVQMRRLGMLGQIGSLGKYCLNRPLGVFIRATLPGTSRIAEVHINLRRQPELLVIGELLTLIPRQ